MGFPVSENRLAKRGARNRGCLEREARRVVD